VGVVEAGVGVEVLVFGEVVSGEFVSEVFVAEVEVFVELQEVAMTSETNVTPPRMIPVSFKKSRLEISPCSWFDSFVIFFLLSCAAATPQIRS
jgi:hypothetical protein